LSHYKIKCIRNEQIFEFFQLFLLRIYCKKVGAFGDLGVSKCVRFEGVKGYAEDVVEGAIVRGSLYYILKRAELRVL
jgi:hypothetical protein